jgi:hypothetical protein
MGFEPQRLVGQNIGSQPDPVTGRTILHYQVLAKLGEGGMAGSTRPAT